LRCPRENASRVIEQHGDFAVLGDLQLLFQFFTKVIRIDHRRVFGDGVGDLFRECARTSLAPVSRMALSKALRPPAMTTSFFKPVVSGSCQISLSSAPAMQAAVAAAIAPADPEVTMPDSAPVSSDKRVRQHAGVGACPRNIRWLPTAPAGLQEIQASR